MSLDRIRPREIEWHRLGTYGEWPVHTANFNPCRSPHARPRPGWRLAALPMMLCSSPRWQTTAPRGTELQTKKGGASREDQLFTNKKGTS